MSCMRLSGSPCDIIMYDPPSHKLKLVVAVVVVEYVGMMKLISIYYVIVKVNVNEAKLCMGWWLRKSTETKHPSQLLQ